MDNFNKPDFSGQNIFVGLDVHKRSWKVSIFSEHLEHKTFTQPPEVNLLVKYLQRNFSGANYHCVYEAGYSGFWIHQQLTKAGVKVSVVNPADVPTRDKERSFKTDAVDCRKLARSLRSGEIESIHVPSRATTEDRFLLRTRTSLVKKQTRCKNQIKSILAFYSISFPEEMATAHWSARFLNWCETLEMEKASGNFALKAHLEELKYLRQSIANINKEIRVLANTDDYLEPVRLLKTIPGISLLSAMTLLTELGDINRFASLDKLASYVGLIPNTHASGEVDRQTNITGRRNAHLRVLLIESAWVAVRKDPALTLVFNRLAKKSTKTRAIVQVARKLLNRIRYVLKNRKEYILCVVE